MFETFLVPLDGSPLAEQALETVIPMVRQAKGRLVLVNAPLVEQQLATSPTPLGSYYLEMSTNQSARKASQYLRSWATKLNAQGVPTQTLITEGIGTPGERIVEAAGEVDADLIVMTSHGYTGIRRLLIGSVTQAVLKNAACPVLVITAKAIESQESIQRFNLVAAD